MLYNFISGSSDTANGKILAKFWEKHVGTKLHAPFSVIGILKEDQVKGVVLFTEYTGSNIDIHFVGPGCVSRTTIRYILNYVFNELKCNMLRAKLHSTNIKIKKYMYRVGFEYEGTLDYYYSLVDHADVYRMDKDKAKMWIKLNVSA